MKNLIPLILLLATVFVSCKKDRECSCKVTTNSTTTTHTQTDGFPPFVPKTDTTIVTYNNSSVDQVTTFKEVSKKKAKFNCFDKEEDLADSTPSSVPGAYTISSVTEGSRKYKCEIK